MNDAFVDALALKNYAVIDNFLTPEEVRFYKSQIDNLYKEEQFKKAGIGAKNTQTVIKEIRSDYIFWLKNDSEQSVLIFKKINELTGSNRLLTVFYVCL